MMMQKTNALFVRLVLVAFGAFAFVACKRQVSAKKMTLSTAAYVYAYSSGTVAKEQPVRVRFTSAVVRTDEIGKSVESGVFNVSPSVSGNAIWEDAQTIRFTPEKGFKSGETYLASVRLKRLFKSVPTDAETFEFDFRARELYFEVNVDGIVPDNQNDMSRQDLVGEVVTSDHTDNAAVEKVLSAKQGNTSLKINWIHAPDGQHHAT
jgi:alpha-2-macroglobulin